MTQATAGARFQDQAVLVTGGAGGIGYATVKRFAAEGARVLFSDIDQARCDAALTRLAADGLAAEAVPADLKTRTGCEGLISQAVDRLGRIDALCNVAGIMVRSDIEGTSDEMWLDSFAVNVHALFYLCRATVPLMRAAGGGAIVNVASAWGLHPAADHLAYNTTKGTVAIFTENLARDCAPHQIRVNAVCPNEVRTAMLEGGFRIRGFDPDKAIAQLNETVPIGRIAEPEEIAAVIAFLASEDAGYMCGSLVKVTGAKAVY